MTTRDPREDGARPGWAMHPTDTPSCHRRRCSPVRLCLDLLFLLTPSHALAPSSQATSLLGHLQAQADRAGFPLSRPSCHIKRAKQDSALWAFWSVRAVLPPAPFCGRDCGPAQERETRSGAGRGAAGLTADVPAPAAGGGPGSASSLRSCKA